MALARIGTAWMFTHVNLSMARFNKVDVVNDYIDSSFVSSNGRGTLTQSKLNHLESLYLQTLKEIQAGQSLCTAGHIACNSVDLPHGSSQVEIYAAILDLLRPRSGQKRRYELLNHLVACDLMTEKTMRMALAY